MAMATVFLGIVDQSLDELVRRSFLSEGGFAIGGEASDGDEVVAQMSLTHPDFVVLEMTIPPNDTLRASEILKLKFPRVRVFAITDLVTLELEKRAFAAGIDAVFATSELSSLVANARDICEASGMSRS